MCPPFDTEARRPPIDAQGEGHSLPERPLRVALATFGCKVNAVDTEELSAALMAAGFQLVHQSEPADVFLLNTCSVTQAADAQARNLIRRFKRKCPGASIVVSGCYATVASEPLERMEEVDYVISNAHKQEIPLLLKKIGPSLKAVGKVNPRPPRKRVRPVMKIQDGCDAYCAYCVVPYGRGPSRSLTRAEVLKRLKILDDKGVAEVILSGICIGRYGLDLEPPYSLTAMLADIIARKPGFRIRLSSLQPDQLTDDIIGLMGESPFICRHLHIPLQSGDERILESMNRPYEAREYAALVEKIASRVPGLGLGTDVMVGFPGEGEGAYENTRAMVKRLPFSYLHVFPYSPRPRTGAARLPDKVPAREIKRRGRELREIGAAKGAAFRKQQLGQTVTVIPEGAFKDDHRLLKGYSDNYLSVLLSAADGQVGRPAPVRLTEVRGELVYGEVCK